MYSYCVFYQRVEEDEYGGTWELLKEGFMTSFALFLVSIVIVIKGPQIDTLLGLCLVPLVCGVMLK